MQLGCLETISQRKPRQSCPSPRSWLCVPSSLPWWYWHKCSSYHALVIRGLTWLETNLSFWLGWFPAGSVAVSLSCAALSCAATWAAAPTKGRWQEGTAVGGREHPFWQLPAGLMIWFKPQIRSHSGSWPPRELGFEEVECFESGIHLKRGQEK